jgi:Tol biopolymer transport system component
MGDVYQATDTKLGRSVAIKFLPEAFSHDIERVARFQREARMLASLNHPNIAAIHGVEEIDSRHFLVMELVSGDTLANRIKDGAVPVAEALPIAKQIAEALEYAHEQGVMHRDLKPSNIMLKPEGTVKVLDFGLAKAFNEDARSPVTSNSPTLSLSATQAGVVLGTAAYMLPEQAKGKELDRRADIWSFGVVVYEILTGRQAFKGETVSETMAFVMTQEPDWEALPDKTPFRLRQLLMRCLVKEPRSRLRDIGEVRLVIEEILTHPETVASPVVIGTSTAPRRRRQQNIAWTLAIVASLLAGSMLWYAGYLRPAPKNATGTIRFMVPPPEKAAWMAFGPSAPNVAISPDGRTLAFVAQSDEVTRIWVRPIDSLEPRPLAGTENVSTAGATPFWSPDNQWIGFFAQGKLKKINVEGGLAQTLCDAPRARGGTWNRSGIILFDRGQEGGTLNRVQATGGRPESITTLDSSRQEQFHQWPYFLPDGEHFLFLSGTSAAEKNAIFVGSLSSKDVKFVLSANSRMVYDNTAGIIFVHDGTLVAVPFDTTKQQVRGEARSIAENVGYNPIGGAASLTVSENGVLAYRTGTLSQTQLVWFDRSGKMIGTAGRPGLYLNPEISPDEKRLAVQRTDPKSRTRDIWVLELERNVMTRLTFDSALDDHPIWSPNGDRIAFRSSRQGSDEIHVKPSSGSGAEEVLLKAFYPWDWAADGRFILVGPPDALEVSVVPLFGDRKPFTYLPRTQFLKGNAQFSFDGRWIAYTSYESGEDEVYVQDFPNPTGKWQISTNGGSSPRWRRDAKEIFYAANDGKLMAVPLRIVGTTLQISSPTALFDIPALPGILGAQYDATGDGQRFLMISGTENETTAITVIVNWTAGLINK